MIWLAQCPVCGLGTRVANQTEEHIVCKCGEPYTVTEDAPPPEPEPEP